MNTIFIKSVAKKSVNISAPLFMGISMLLLTSSSALADGPKIRYVSPSSSGKGDGSSWANACSDLHKIINASSNGDQVWISAAAHKPTYYNAVKSSAAKSGVKSYLLKMCSIAMPSPSNCILFDPMKEVRIPSYNFPLLRPMTKQDPESYLVIQII
ncbi:hypothetical protein [Parasediminibacterium sp. JCM 36343]|uniref:hypothetical protein n=1 Tax=Parasediminibacterium sp. JCM 36343 TaxID=3374279 RepID=UPI00397B5C6B